jgi:hypothetical protein
VNSSGGSAAGDPPRRSWAGIAWGRAASYAVSADDQVAAAERALRRGMTLEEARAALGASPHLERVFGTDLLSNHGLVNSPRFRKTKIRLRSRGPVRVEAAVTAQTVKGPKSREDSTGRARRPRLVVGRSICWRFRRDAFSPRQHHRSL